ncbi:MAG TPA: M28 family peptidase [Rhodocyclaceae bacterium]|nr:M28 family peptidase [Rhodocyclaceae bacterium]
MSMRWSRQHSVGVFALVSLLAAVLAVGWVTQPIFGSGVATREAWPASEEKLRSDVEYLTGVLGRRHHARSDTLRRTADFLKRSLVEAGATVSEQSYEVEGARYVNVVARFGPTGSDPLIVGAHYDVEEGTRGADDNASGVAVLLDAAHWLGRRSDIQAPVELVFYTLEEPPYFRSEFMGSWQHASQLEAAGVRPRLVVVLEMLGYFSDASGSQSYPLPGMSLLYPDRGDFLAVVGHLGNPRVVRRVKSSLRAASDLPIESINAPAWLPGMDFSDHASYWAKGMPAVMLTDTSFYRNPHYHKASDLPHTLDYVRMAKVAAGVKKIIKDAALAKDE